MTDRQYDGPPEAIRKQLRRVLNSQGFDASERNRRFLEYVVDETLAGRAKCIKAYSVATDVFGRSDSFDPQLDPIVRIEAGRLRRSLERYYLTIGGGDPIRITIPKGSYMPEFEAAEAALTDTHIGSMQTDAAGEVCPSAMLGSTRQSMRLKEGRPAIFVSAFEEEGDLSAFPNFARGFTLEVIAKLTSFYYLCVFGPETPFRYIQDGSVQRFAEDFGIDFILTGCATVSAEHFAVRTLLHDVKTGQNLWSACFEGEISSEDIIKLRDEVANKVARSLAEPYGAIFSEQVIESDGKPLDMLTPCECVNQFHLYRKTYQRKDYHDVRTCLERAVVANPNYAEAFAALSLIYCDSYRFGFDDGAITVDPRRKALELARRAIELAPNAARAYHALSLAYWFTNDVERSLEAARAGLRLNPNDSELMADLGMRYAFRNEWEKGVPLLRAAFAQNPALSSGYRLVFSLDHCLHGRYEKALAEAKSIDAPDLIYSGIVLAMAAAGLGLMQEAEEAVRRIRTIDPAYGDHVVEDLEKRNIHPDLISNIVGRLRKAGLPVLQKVISKAS